MHSPEHCFTPFQQSIDLQTLPERFTFPFYYEPHPLCLQAAAELQRHLVTQRNWQHNFGLDGNTETATGKMFGVLVVQNAQGEIGYLSAFSGKLADQNLLPHFVPPVFDMLAKDSFFLAEQVEINQINARIETLEADPQLAELAAQLKAAQQQADTEITALQGEIVAARKIRKQRRAEGEATLAEDALQDLLAALGRESIDEKYRVKDLKRHWREQVSRLQTQYDALVTQIEALKTQRKQQSSALQAKIFAQYRFLNAHGDEKSLGELFSATPQGIPPAGAGECAAPKLLHYAYKWGMKPLAMAEFWWGRSPKSEIRQHQNFYPACRGKCQPILAHMLEGLDVDENPMLTNPAAGKALEFVYQDEAMVVVNKPAEFLSVPGKTIEDSVYLRIRECFPQATGPLIVHRLDMSTSGLMVLALTKDANKALQQQFIQRTVTKRYVALIEGEVDQDEGEIHLPLRGDIDDRPRQLVCRQHGKPAETYWQVAERKAGRTKVYLYPKTGRTHQLRVHCAHVDGLASPIVGDDLYGVRAERLHLHAELLELNHPVTREPMCFQAEAEF
ncbi:RluA family pseudouridine synthase [Photobacterium atrarenae]|uniref:Pseudouridine synthase n=1 Tax=Photobacterium atrarenae TaxID=865757 RepID=A0ABY5GLD6_9GAMM|nr:RluA family pseudouridine synthase [Photobacterium atrarenae]UTV29991.1 pseudouridine synthase [Photobacterium atrarenae]